MKILNANRQNNLEINNLLQKIKYGTDRREKNDSIALITITKEGFETTQHESDTLILKLKSLGAIEAIRSNFSGINYSRGLDGDIIDAKQEFAWGYTIKIIEPKFSQLCDEYEKKVNDFHNEKQDKNQVKVKFVNGILDFKNKKIDFNKKPNQKDLLLTLFKNPKKNWFYDEIYEDWGENDFVKNGWRKLYTAGDGINKAIAIETSIKSFIIKNTKQIQINQEYI